MLDNLLKKLRPLLIKLLIYIESKPKRVKIKTTSDRLRIYPTGFLVLNFLLVYTILAFHFGLKIEKLLLLFVLFLAITLLFIYYLYTSFKDILRNQGLASASGFLFFMYLSAFVLLGSQFQISPYFFPISSLAAFVVILTQDRRYAIDIALAITLIVFIVYELTIEKLLFHLLSMVFIAYIAEKALTRKDLIICGVKTAFFNVIFILMASILFFKFNKENLIEGFLNGVTASIFLGLFVNPISNLFSITTNLKLFELANLNHPLMKKLMVEAPGTYHHSLIVSSLAEQSANLVGANPLLAKVCGYFHDIGKLIKPEYFIENQTAENPHDLFTSTMSSLIIISHIKEGVRLALEYNLDKTLIELMEQHHGTSRIHSLQTDSDEEFRYPGPKPSTREAAILMLADSCEAAVRSIYPISPQRIKETVETVINNKFIDGQLDESPLTLSDLYKIANAMTTTLISIYHLREKTKKEM